MSEFVITPVGGGRFDVARDRRPVQYDLDLAAAKAVVQRLIKPKDRATLLAKDGYPEDITRDLG